jgi:predicted transcriptional regulator
MIEKGALARLTAEVVSSYVGKSTLTDSELDRATVQIPLLIDRVHEALLRIIRSEELLGGHAGDVAPGARGAGGTPFAASDPEVEEVLPISEARADSPAVPIDGSVHDDYLICLEDGLKFKTLKRHLKAKFGMSPEAYRAKWGLAPDYPMACKSYTDSRSRIATRIGLGAGGRGSQPAYAKKAPARKKAASR